MAPFFYDFVFRINGPNCDRGRRDRDLILRLPLRRLFPSS